MNTFSVSKDYFDMPTHTKQTFTFLEGLPPLLPMLPNSPSGLSLSISFPNQHSWEKIIDSNSEIWVLLLTEYLYEGKDIDHELGTGGRPSGLNS